MGRLVMKFGGTSVADIDRIRNVARHVEREVSAGHQVVVVTHLPQLAGYGDAHFHVSKAVAGGRTTTRVDLLDPPGRVRELAAMLGTQGDTARSGAESILHHVAQAKNGLPVEEY